MELSEIALRFIITFVLSLIFGIERQKSHKPIRFGTFTFVSVGSCGLAITAVTLGLNNSIALLGATITGIGFLGAGALIKTGDKIFGANTAASIWLFAIFGLIIGTGHYVIGGCIYAIVWVIIMFDRFLEKKGIGSYQKKMIITTNKIVDESELNSIFPKRCSKLISMEVNKKTESMVLSYLIEGTKDQLNNLPKRIYKKDWFESFRVE